jgi:P4 family phage/plasmid primase-like protien
MGQLEAICDNMQNLRINDPPCKPLNVLLKKYRENSEQHHTHVSFVGGKYNVPEEDTISFLQSYFSTAQKDKQALYLVEKVGDTFAYFLDLDFDTNGGKENVDTVQLVLDKTSDLIRETMSAEPSVLEFVVSKRMHKFHVNFPNFIVNPEHAIKFTEILKQRLDDGVSKCIDSSVYRTGLRMLGSRKSDRLEKDKDQPGFESAYRIFDMETRTTVRLDDTSFDTFLKTVVRRPKAQLTPLQFPAEGPKGTHVADSPTVGVKVKGHVPPELVKDIHALLKELSQTNESFHMLDLTPEKIVYAQNKVGHMCYYVSIKDRFCPFKERAHTRETNPVYLELSRRGFTVRCFDEECLRKSFPKVPVPFSKSMQVDYSEVYKTLTTSSWNKEVEVDSKTQQLLENSLSCTHYNIAKVLFHLYKSSFRIDEIRNPEWYEFISHRWQKSHAMYINVSEELPKYYRSIKTSQVESIEDVSDQETKTKNVLNDRIETIVRKLESVSFKRDVLNDAKYLFHTLEPGFASKLNSDPNLIGFKNGVYDLATGTFRAGRLEDHITFTTGYDYVDYDPENETTKEIYTFLKQILVNEDVREYTLKTLAKSLEGVPDEKFYIWTGLSGANGKSTLVNFLEMTLGDYSTSLDVSILTNKRPNSSAATPDIVEMRGKRAIFFQEPESNDRLHVGILKQFTGNDIIKCRELFKSPISFRSMASFVMCCNELPKVTSMDGGTWRRIRVIEFKSRFCENPTKANEFKIDPALKYKLKDWRPFFMSILLHYYRKVQEEGISEPLEVFESTANYKTENDKYNDFFEESIHVDEQSFMSHNELYLVFEDWWKANFNIEKVPSKQEFKKVLRNKFGEEREASVDNRKLKGFALRLKTDGPRELDALE